MKKIGLISALEFEIPDQLNYNYSKNIQKFRAKENEIGVMVSGVGQENAIEATRVLCLEYNPDFIIFMGFCGGVSNDCKVNDLFIADSVHYNGDEISIDPQMLEYVKKRLSRNKYNPIIGKFQTFDEVVLSKKEIASDVIAVEMESYGSVKEANKYDVPTILVKSVSDIIPDKKPVFAAKYRSQREFIKNIHNAKKSLNDFYYSFFLQ